MKKIICALMLLCLVDFAMGAHINEIMYNPSGDDNNREFVEIKGTDNLTGYKIGDRAINDSLQMLQYFPSNFSLIVEEGYNYSGLNCSIYSVGATIGNNLDNGGDTVNLLLNAELVDSVIYTSDLAYGNDRSLELIGNNWVESVLIGGSPCMENGNITAIIINTTINDTINDSINDTIDPINNTINDSINDTINDSINDTIINITINQSCNLSLMLYLEKTLYENQEKIEFYNVLPEAPDYFLIEYWIEDLYGNIIRIHNTSNLNAKSYTPDIDEKEKAFIIRNKLLEPQCNLSSQEYIIVRNNISIEVPEPNNVSRIEIKELIIGTDNRAEFGEVIKVRLNIYKGKTTKTAVNAYITSEDKKVSEITSLNVYTQYSNNDLSIPIAILPNCDKKLLEGHYELVVEGLDAVDKEELELLGYNKDSCEEITKECSACPKCTESKLNQSLNKFLEKLKNMTEYEIINITQLQNNTVLTQIRIRNIRNITTSFEVYSYIYKGTKTYSGNKTTNMLNLTLNPGEDKVIDLMNRVNGAAGEYKLKIMVKKDFRKTYDQLTEGFEIKSNSIQLLLPPLNQSINKTIENLMTGETIYLAKNVRATKYIKYFILVLAGVGCLIYFVRRNGQKRTEETDRRRLGKSSRDIRDSWESQSVC